MNTTNLRYSAKSAPQPAAGETTSSLRIFLFPLLTNVWPLLLFVSQKAFVIPGLLLAGFGDNAYRRDILIAAAICLCGILVYILQYSNSYDQAHLVGFLLFVWSMPLINRATRHDSQNLKRILTYLTLANALFGFFLLNSTIDLYGLRGLNRIVGTDAVTYRVYFESTCLGAVILISSFRSRWMQVAALAVIAAFLIFVAKSVAVILLLGANLSLPYLLRSSFAVKFIVGMVTALTLVVLYIYLPVLRPDVDLSLRVKQFQLDIILSSLGNSLSGWGWGAVYPELASDPEQPYQIEMQLPMLLLQLGPIALVAILALIFLMFQSTTKRPIFALGRYTAYLLIGFNNPWLFIPSWYLTCQLLFRYENEFPR